MRPAEQIEIDYTVQCRTSLEAIRRIGEELETAPQRLREKWRDYGAGLMAQRARMSSNNEFGEWVHDNGLDASPAASAGARSDAMWFAEHYDVLCTHIKRCTRNSPTEIRRWCREQGIEAAHETKRTKERKEKTKANPKPKAKRYSWTDVAASEGALASGKTGGATQDLKAELLERGAPPGLFKDAAKEPELRQAVKDFIAESPRRLGKAAESIRNKVAEKDHERFNAALSKAVDAEIKAVRKQMQAEFDRAVSDAVEARVADARAHYEESARKAREQIEIYTTRKDGVRRAMTKDEWRLVVGCLHSDKLQSLTEKQRAQFDAALAVVLRLKDYVSK